MGDTFYSFNSNGNEVFMPIWLKDNLGNKFLLPNTVIDMSNKKTIVETPMVNRKGSVKEEISIEDWDINIKGIIVSSDYDYPDELVQQLNSWYNLGYALEIINAKTGLILEDQEKVVLKSLRFPEVKGMKNIQPFEMNLVSDYDFQLIIE